eukprot:5227997-Alexandrium_andersonii.AAC.1
MGTRASEALRADQVLGQAARLRTQGRSIPTPGLAGIRLPPAGGITPARTGGFPNDQPSFGVRGGLPDVVRL